MLNNKLIINSWSGYYFGIEAFKNKEATRALWDEVVKAFQEKRDKSREQEQKRIDAKREFREWYVKHHVNLSARKIKSIQDEIDNSIPTYFTTTPNLMAWVQLEEDILYKVDANSGYGMEFDKAYTMVENWLERRNKTNERSERIFKAALEYCIANNLEWNSQNAVSVATQHKAEALEREAIEAHREIDIDCCDYCSTWIAGERRCSCGNRRVSFSYDGDFPNIYIYPEAW